MQMIVVGGEQIAVVEIEDASLVEHLPDATIKEWLVEAGYEDPDVEDTLAALNEAGFDMPAAWTKVPDSRLIEAGVGPGYINLLVSVFQTQLVRRCGTVFVRRMQGTARTDEQVALELVKLKHVPKAPVVSEKAGYGCSGELWREYLQLMANWSRPATSKLAQSIQQIRDSEKIGPGELFVAQHSPLSVSLGTILRGESGLGDLKELVSDVTLNTGCGLTILLELTRALLGSLDSALFAGWRKLAVPVREAALVAATVLKWTAKRDRLRARGRAAVDDPEIALESLLAWVSQCQSEVNHCLSGEAAWDSTYSTAGFGQARSGFNVLDGQEGEQHTSRGRGRESIRGRRSWSRGDGICSRVCCCREEVEERWTLCAGCKEDAWAVHGAYVQQWWLH